MARAIWLVMDSFGIGGAPDAEAYADADADTFGHIAAICAKLTRGPLRLPTLTRLGLAHAHALATGARAAGFEDVPEPEGLWGCMAERASGKDTPSGHWETAGVTLKHPFGLFDASENSFPPELLEALVREARLPGVLGNCHASGTEIIQRLGAEHIASGKPIVYTSADSVLQIAAHEDHFGLERLHEVCLIARRLLEPWNIGRVIARPFVGTVDAGFTRTGNRHDYALEPPGHTLLDAVCEVGHAVHAIGKISDIFAARGVTHKRLASGHDALFDATVEALAQAGDGDLIATNFVDFDSVYGHRRDVPGYAAALEHFDARLPALLDALKPGDLLAISADHGCDPTFPGSDHTREQVPLLAFAPGSQARSLGQRGSFADLGQGLAAHLGLPPLAEGRSFLTE